MDEEAVKATRVPRRRSGSEESEATHERFFGDNLDAWWRVAWLWVTGFLGFGRERSWSTSMVLASSGEAWICADLILSHGLLGLLDFDTAQSHGGCEMSWSLDLAGKHV